MGPTAMSFVQLDGGITGGLSFGRIAQTGVQTMGWCLFFCLLFCFSLKSNSSSPTLPPQSTLFPPPKKFSLKKKTARAAVSVSPLEGPAAFHQITAARLNILYLIKDSLSRAIQTEKSTRVMKRAKKTHSFFLSISLSLSLSLSKKVAHLRRSRSVFTHFATSVRGEGRGGETRCRLFSFLFFSLAIRKRKRKDPATHIVALAQPGSVSAPSMIRASRGLRRKCPLGEAHESHFIFLPSFIYLFFLSCPTRVQRRRFRGAMHF